MNVLSRMMVGLMCVLLGFTWGCDPVSLPGNSECPPGTYGPFKCSGLECGGLKAGCLVDQDGSQYQFISCELAAYMALQQPSCNDTKKNGAETYIDCGGGCPVGCDNSRPCREGTDCKSGCCTSDEVCDEDTDQDGVCDSEDLDEAPADPS